MPDIEAVREEGPWTVYQGTDEEIYTWTGSMTAVEVTKP